MTSGHAELPDCQQSRLASKTRAMTVEAMRKKLLYRALHRGTKELDLLVGGFAQSRLDGLGVDELNQFETILEFPENDLADWFMGREPVPASADCPLLRDMLAYRPIPQS
jgi:antitoxin CptB